MKKVLLPLWIFCWSGFLGPAQTNESVLKLTGIISLPDFRRALLESPGPPRGEGLVTLGEGERQGKFEVLIIKDREGSVDVVNGGKRATLEFGILAAVSAAETAGSNLRLANANLEQVLDVYARINGRTVLQHPSLKATLLSLNAAAKTRSEAVAILEQLFQRHGMTSIPDGSKFVMIVPSSLTNTVSARSGGIVPTPAESAALPNGVIDFRNADLRQALAIYGRLVGRKLVKAEGLRSSTIRLRTATDLTKSEAAYALETLFRWNGVNVVPVGETEFHAVPILPGAR